MSNSKLDILLFYLKLAVSPVTQVMTARVLIVTIIILFLSVSVAAQDSKRQIAEKALAEAERLDKAWWVYGNLEKQLNEYEKALIIWRELSDKKREANTLLQMAETQSFLENKGGYSEKSKQFSLQALEIFKTLDDKEGEAFALCHIAWQESFDSLEKSKLLFEAALSLAKQNKARKAGRYIFFKFALVLSDKGESEKALEMLDQALAIAREIKEVKGEAEVYFAYGLAYWRIGDYEKSLVHYEQAHKLYKEFGDFSWATTSIENAALVYNLLEQPEKVLESYREALPFRRETKQVTAIADNQTSIATALVKLNQPKKALENLSEAVQIYEQTKNPWGFGWAWRIYGEAYLALGNYDKAIEFFQKSRAQQAELKEQDGIAKATYFLAKTELAKNNPTQARQHIEEALALIENQRADLRSQDLRLAFFSARRDYYELYLEILLRLHAANPKGGNDLSALEISERSRARNLFEILSGRNTTVRQSVETLSAKEIQNLLDENTALLEYTLGKHASFLFVVTKNKVLVFNLPKADEIEPLVQEIRLALSESGRRNYARFVTASRRLYEILFKPAESELKTKKNLLVAPDAALNYLPFDVLLTAEPQRTGQADFQKLPFALNHWTINYTPSASVLAEIKQSSSKTDYHNPQSAIRNPQSENPQSENPQSKNPQFVAFADPVYNQSNKIASSRVRRFVGEAFTNATMPRLADSNREVQSIASGFGDSARLFLRQKATEQNVKQNTEIEAAYILHFATHGVVNERLPQYSGLLLSADSSEDGLLQTEEIYNLKLNADLVVLSACRTALGKNLRGEGVIGLTRSFLRAGASSVAATLWQVEDASTADLMIAFYANLKTSTNKASALREAKLSMLKNERLAHPYFWASFVLIGEP
jgi:CHAT domain-containing protein